jgi:hypothetical protein
MVIATKAMNQLIIYPYCTRSWSPTTIIRVSCATLFDPSLQDFPKMAQKGGTRVWGRRWWRLGSRPVVFLFIQFRPLVPSDPTKPNRQIVGINRRGINPCRSRDRPKFRRLGVEIVHRQSLLGHKISLSSVHDCFFLFWKPPRRPKPARGPHTRGYKPCAIHGSGVCIAFLRVCESWGISPKPRV